VSYPGQDIEWGEGRVWWRERRERREREGEGGRGREREAKAWFSFGQEDRRGERIESRELVGRGSGSQRGCDVARGRGIEVSVGP
jgi:hypothetical protein